MASVLRPCAAFDLLRYSIQIARFARKRGVDLIHTNSLKSDIYGGLAGRLARIPVIWHIRDHINAKYLPKRAAICFAWLARHLPQAIIANSESTLHCLRATRSQRSTVVYSGVMQTQSSRNMIVHDGISNTFLTDAPASEHTNREATPIVSLVGRIAPWKGQDIFIHAAAEVLQSVPNVKFRIIGSPLFGENDYEASLQRMSHELGIADHIKFLGFREDIPALLEETDLLVHASVLGEPFGQVVIEGMAAGKPVIATDGGALPEIVVPGETGILVPMGDAPAMARAIQDILNDKARAQRMGAAGQRRVQERFTIHHTAQKVEVLYANMLHHAQPPMTLTPAGQEF